LGRLDFFESALAFMAGYGLRAYLIAQSLNQIDRAYGPNHSILDNCHVRVAFATNDERTAKRISDALGTATELRAQRNYAGHRLAPWLGHLMVSRQESARPLLTPGEVMQLAPHEELVMVSGHAPIRAQKLRYHEDGNFIGRVLRPPQLVAHAYPDCPPPRANDWDHPVSSDSLTICPDPSNTPSVLATDDGGREHRPGLERLSEVEPAVDDLNLLDDDEVAFERASSARADRDHRHQPGRDSCDPAQGIAL
jgi:type IV secretion system protein VirD4